jgi:serine/threonine protein kinase
VLALFLQIGAGLAAVHQAGLVHRDFKPDNVLVDRAGKARVVDFGLARVSLDTSTSTMSPELAASLTRSGMMLGTPGYIAPEQQFGGGVDARADQYSFCVALREGLLGSRTASADDPRWQGIPRWLRSAVSRGLSYDPDERFPSMRELLGELARVDRRRARLSTAIIACVVVVGGIVGAFAIANRESGDRTVGSADRIVESGGQTATSGGQTATSGGQTATSGGQTLGSGGQTVGSGGSFVAAGDGMAGAQQATVATPPSIDTTRVPPVTTRPDTTRSSTPPTTSSTPPTTSSTGPATSPTRPTTSSKPPTTSSTPSTSPKPPTTSSTPPPTTSPTPPPTTSPTVGSRPGTPKATSPTPPGKAASPDDSHHDNPYHDGNPYDDNKGSGSAGTTGKATGPDATGHSPPAPPAPTRHAFPSAHRGSLSAIVSQLGYRGLAFDADLAADERDTVAKIDAVVDDQLEKGKLQWMLGEVQRKRGHCDEAIATYLASRKTLADYNSKNRHDNKMWTYFSFDVFGTGLCELELGRIDDGIRDLDGALTTSFAMGEVIHGELLVAIGILEYETRDPKRGKETILHGARSGDAKLRAAVEAWAAAVGMPLP